MEKELNRTTEFVVKRLEKEGYKKYGLQSIVNDILKVCGIYNQRCATPIIKIAQAFDIVTYRESFKEKGLDGILYVGGNTKKLYGENKVIVVGNEQTIYYQRYVVARQLGTYLLKFVSNKEDINFFKDQFHTEEIFASSADKFATSILMPEKMFKHQLNVANKLRYDDDFWVITYMSMYFEVPNFLVEKRIKELVKKS